MRQFDNPIDRKTAALRGTYGELLEMHNILKIQIAQNSNLTKED
jgi:hypothetical protein